jgi:hypothetical protein
VALAIATRTPIGWWMEHGTPEVVAAAVEVLKERNRKG